MKSEERVAGGERNYRGRERKGPKKLNERGRENYGIDDHDIINQIRSSLIPRRSIQQFIMAQNTARKI